MRHSSLLLTLLIISEASLFLTSSYHYSGDPCDAYGDCVSATLTYARANPDYSLYLGDQFSITITTTAGSGSSGSTSWSGSLEGISWAYDGRAFDANATGLAARFIVVENTTGSYAITATATFLVSITTCATSSNGQTTCTTSYTQTSVPISEQVSLRAFVLIFRTRLVNVTGADGFTFRNEDGSFYRSDSFCDSWNATFLFASERTDIEINVTSVTPPSLSILNYSAGVLGSSGSFCYAVRADSAYQSFDAVLRASVLNWQGTILGQRKSSQGFAVVQYDPTFTTYAYMLYRNSTASSSLQRPWVLFVRYDGNNPGYSYAGDNNTRPFTSGTLAERAYFDGFHFLTLSYQPFTTESGVFDFHVVNSTAPIDYDWLSTKDSAPLYYGNRIEKYVFNATTSSLSPLLAQRFIYQNITMVGCWRQEGVCNLRQNYWLVPFLWNGRLNVVSVDSNGNLIPNMPISITIHDPSPLNQWLTADFEHIFGNDSRALTAFEADLYPTNPTMTFSGVESLKILLNQTSLSPPQISITAGGVSVSGNFNFVPTFVNSTIMSVPNSLNGTVFYANATIPLWSYNMVRGSLSFLPISTTIDHHSTFLELVNSTGWIAGNTTAPQTPSAFASQRYGFWPLGQNLTIYANLQGGGIRLLGTQKVGPNQYQASFYVERWSGGISSVRLIQDGSVVENESTLNKEAFPSPLPQGLTGLLALSYPATGQDVTAVFTNIWGVTTAIHLGASQAPSPTISLVPTTTAIAFVMAMIMWLLVSDVLKSRKASIRE